MTQIYDLTVGTTSSVYVWYDLFLWPNMQDNCRGCAGVDMSRHDIGCRVQTVVGAVLSCTYLWKNTTAIVCSTTRLIIQFPSYMSSHLSLVYLGPRPSELKVKASYVVPNQSFPMRAQIVEMLVKVLYRLVTRQFGARF